VLTEARRARLNTAIKAEFDRLSLEAIARGQRQRGRSAGAETAEAGTDGDGKTAPPMPKAPPMPMARKVTGGLVSNTELALTSFTRPAPRTAAPSWLAG